MREVCATEPTLVPHDDLVEEIRAALKKSAWLGEMVGRYQPYMPELTERMLGIMCDASFATFCDVLDKIIEEKLGVTIGG